MESTSEQCHGRGEGIFISVLTSEPQYLPRDVTSTKPARICEYNIYRNQHSNSVLLEDPHRPEIIKPKSAASSVGRVNIITVLLALALDMFALHIHGDAFPWQKVGVFLDDDLKYWVDLHNTSTSVPEDNRLLRTRQGTNARWAKACSAWVAVCVSRITT